jgi:hypothetical protein
MQLPFNNCQRILVTTNDYGVASMDGEQDPLTLLSIQIARYWDEIDQGEN